MGKLNLYFKTSIKHTKTVLNNLTKPVMTVKRKKEKYF